MSRFGSFPHGSLDSFILGLNAVRANGMGYALALFFTEVGTAPSALYSHAPRYELLQEPGEP